MDLLEFMMELGLALFGLEKYDAIYNRIRYLTSQKVELIMLLLVIMPKLKMILMIPCI